MKLARLVTFTLHPHDNADTLSIAKIDGSDWQCVVRTADWTPSPNGLCFGVYIGLEALLDPTRPEFSFVKATKKFPDGRPGHRVKTIRLRGKLSQGLIIPTPKGWGGNLDELESFLGIERYEPPLPIEMSGDMIRQPGSFSKYCSIENAKNFPNFFSEEDTVRITEKLHGTNFRVGLVDDGREDGPIYIVGSNTTAKSTEGTNIYSEMARQFVPEGLVRALARELGISFTEHFIVFGEIYGHKIQDLNYGCKVNERQVRIFDLLVDHNWLPWDMIEKSAKFLGLATVPLLYSGPYGKDKVIELRDGQTTVPQGAHMREGVVVTTTPEQRVETEEYRGRKILKYVSDAYLERHDAKDGH